MKNTPISVADSFNQQPHRTSRLLWVAGGIIATAIAFAFVAIVLERNRVEPLSARANVDSVLIALTPSVFVATAAGEIESDIGAPRVVSAGDEIETSTNGEAVLLYPNGTVTKLDQNTQIRIEALSADGSTSRLALLSGSMWARLEHALEDDEAYEVHSQGVVTSVRGTEFDMSTDGTSVVVSILSGEVELQEGTGAVTPVRAVAGEQVAFIRDAEDGTLEAVSVPLPQEVFAEKVAAHAAVARGLAARVPAEAEGGVVSVVDRAMEFVVTGLETDSDAKTVRQLALADERLREAQALADQGNSSAVISALEAYRELITTASFRSDVSADVRAQVAETTLAHADVLAALEEQVPEEVQAFLEEARTSVQQGNIQAVDALADSDPERSFALAAQSQKRALRTFRERAVAGQTTDAIDALGLYERTAQEAHAIAEATPSLLPQYVQAVTRNLRTLEAANAALPSPSPELAQQISRSRNAAIDAQLVALAEVVRDDPQTAVVLYTDAAGQYANEAQRHANQREEDEAAQAADAYVRYAEFGEEVSLFAGRIRTSDSDVRDLTNAATTQHEEVLKDTIERVSEPARTSIERAIEAADRIQNVIPNEESDVDALIRSRKEQTSDPNQETNVDTPTLPEPVPTPGDSAPALPSNAPEADERLNNTNSTDAVTDTDEVSVPSPTEVVPQTRSVDVPN